MIDVDATNLSVLFPELKVSTNVRDHFINVLIERGKQREVWLMNTLDERVRSHLIALGWTPPASKPQPQEVTEQGSPHDCQCIECNPGPRQMMVLCPKCGNKRCPHANSHRYACTNSNATGQSGSAYP